MRSQTLEILPEHKATMASAEHLCDALEKGLPKGATPETVGEFIEVHLRELAAIKQTIGKNVLMLRLTSLASKYPVVGLREVET